MNEKVTHFPRQVRSVPSPLGLYLRPGRNDHLQLSTLLLSGTQKMFGAVIDATLLDRHKELRDQLASSKLDLILDPKTQQAGTIGGFTPSLAALPWGEARPNVPDDYRSFAGRQRVIKLAEFAVANSFTQVMAPTHLILSADDPWLAVDVESARTLRVELDRRGGKNIPIIYSLALSYGVFKDLKQRRTVLHSIRDIPVASLWLKIDGFGADANPTAMSNYLDAAADFHVLGIPLVADYVGGIPALSLLAFGAVGGIAHGITASESFNSYRWRNPKKSKGGAGGWRVYFPPLGILLAQDEAKLLLDSSPRAKALFSNRNQLACPRGSEDMLSNPVRAFVIQRAEEVANLSSVPETLRPQSFLDTNVRPTTDLALAASKIDWGNDPFGQKLAKKLSAHRKSVDDIRISLGTRAHRAPPKSFALHPPTRLVREG